MSDKLIKHIPMDELKKLIRKEKDKYLFERLLFIRQLYRGDSVIQACDTLCISEQTGYNWLQQWNEKGYEGLKPEFGGGAPPKLTDQEKEQVKEKLKEKGNWMASEVKALIRKEFHVSYSDRHVSRILRGFGMHYAKPYPHDYRRPENAEEILMERIEAAMQNAPQDSVIGFIDEASPQTTDNRQRFWSFGKPTIRKNTSKYKANAFGFYPVNGTEVLEFMDNGKAGSVCEFLRKISDRNHRKHIVAFADNAPSHKAQLTRQFAAQHNITLVFLPVYSPDLNPIEPIWKSGRRRLSQVSFIKSEWAFRETMRTSFHHLAKRKTFMGKWLEKFGGLFPNLLCQ